ncbi:MAG: DUF192 domain-containing protein [Methylocystis sp.]|nr:DUF192 domain-containing protein [Methylocystis sp.]MBI3274898.1 DUF192 domain-containing protein [Methylocystis sp.]
MRALTRPGFAGPPSPIANRVFPVCASNAEVGNSRLRCGRGKQVALACLVAFGLAAAAAAGQAGVEPLEIITASGTHVFRVEVARTSPQRERGLMFRRFLPADRGMLFDFQVEDKVLMWMKNTYIPLDMIFVSRKGGVVSVAQDAEPMSERVIASGAPAYAVIELNAGAARKIGVAVGDAVRHPIFRE